MGGAEAGRSSECRRAGLAGPQMTDRTGQDRSGDGRRAGPVTALPPPGRAPALAPGIGRLLLPSPGRAQGRHSRSGPAGTRVVHAVPTSTATRHTQVQHEGWQVTVTSRTWGGPAPEPGSEGGCGKGDAGDRSEREEDRRQTTWREVPGVEEECTGMKRGHSNSLMAPARSSSPAQTDPGRGTRRSVQGAASCTASRDTAAAARALAVSTGLGGGAPTAASQREQGQHGGSSDTTPTRAPRLPLSPDMGEPACQPRDPRGR